MVCVAPRAPEEIVRPRRSSNVVVRPLNFTVRRTPMTADRVIALVLGLLAISIGVNGVRIGTVLTKSIRAPAYFSRDSEPVAFWIVVCLWIALGTFIVAVVLLRKVPV